MLSYVDVKKIKEILSAVCDQVTYSPKSGTFTARKSYFNNTSSPEKVAQAISLVLAPANYMVKVVGCVDRAMPCGGSTVASNPHYKVVFKAS